MDDAHVRAQKARESCPFLSTKQAAFHLGLSPRTLAQMRRSGRGPACRRHGGLCQYHIDDLESWSKGEARD